MVFSFSEKTKYFLYLLGHFYLVFIFSSCFFELKSLQIVLKRSAPLYLKNNMVFFAQLIPKLLNSCEFLFSPVQACPCHLCYIWDKEMMKIWNCFSGCTNSGFAMCVCQTQMGLTESLFASGSSRTWKHLTSGLHRWSRDKLPSAAHAPGQPLWYHSIIRPIYSWVLVLRLIALKKMTASSIAGKKK